MDNQEKIIPQAFLDKKGVEFLWSQLSLEDYPNNETLIAVLDAVDRTKADKENVAFISEEDSEDIVVVETASPYAGTIHRFSVEVNCAPMYIQEDNLGPEFNDSYQPYTDYGVLIFPDSYTDKGKKTRLVISAHGGGGTVSADSSQAEYQSISRYLVANGYAVMDVNGLPEQYAIDHGNLRLQDSVGSYLAMQSYIKAYNYCMEPMLSQTSHISE